MVWHCYCSGKVHEMSMMFRSNAIFNDHSDHTLDLNKMLMASTPWMGDIIIL